MKHTFECKFCKKSVTKLIRNKKLPIFCDRTCSNSDPKKPNRHIASKNRRRKNCRHCSHDFIGSSNQKLCSELCKRLAAATRRANSDKQSKNRYGVSSEDYERMLLDQANACWICKRNEVGQRNCKKFYIDHCHETGKVRGLLCYSCNTILGHARDNVEILMRAIEYLNRSRIQNATI